MGATGFGATFKWKASSGDSLAALTTVTDIEPDSLKLGEIKMKIPLSDSGRWHTFRAGDKTPGMLKVSCTWLKSEYETIRDLQDDRTDAYWELTTTEDSSKWDFRGFVTEVEYPKFKTSDEGVEELLWGFSIRMTAEPVFTPGA